MKKVLICAATFDTRVEKYRQLVQDLGGEPLFFIKVSALLGDWQYKESLVRESDVGVVLLSSVEDYWLLGAANATKKPYILVVGKEEPVPKSVLEHGFIKVARDDREAEVFLQGFFG